MDAAPRFFTIEEANALVPTLELEFGRVARLRSQIRPLVEALGGADAAVDVLQRGATPAAGHEGEARVLRRLADEVASAVERVNGLGCVVKDLDVGLVDFFAMHQDEPVFLCWQFGEPRICHWHPIDEGFSGRRPLAGVELGRPPLAN